MGEMQTNLFVVTVAYIVAFTVTLGFIFPLQEILFQNVSSLVGLIFLPHGVRVLSIHFFGWRGMFYVLPASYLMWWLSVHGSEIPIHPIAPVISLLACYCGYHIAYLIIAPNRRNFGRATWKALILAGMFASLLNAFALSLVHSGTMIWHDVLGYVIGDVSGLVVCMMSIMYGFRLLRHYKTLGE